MSDQTAGGPFAPQRTPQGEFRIYFAIIFAVALPIETLGWSLRLLRDRCLPPSGPLARATRLANEITPMIFWP